MGNFEGYDIDSGMVCIAQVNIINLRTLKIYSDTLSMDERWSDKFTVILEGTSFYVAKEVAFTTSLVFNPTRSEVLFVDYIMNPPDPRDEPGSLQFEGIIFQTGSAHKQLRKNLLRMDFMQLQPSLWCF